MPAIIEWEELVDAFSYKIKRSPTGTADTFVEIATDVIGTAFQDPTGAITFFYQIISVSKAGVELKTTTPLIVYDAVNVCKVFGVIQDVSGRPEADAEIRFQIRRDAFPQSLNDTAKDLNLTGDEVLVFTNELGNFEIFLIRNVTVQMYVPKTRLSVEFMVPDQDTVDFTKIDGVFGFASPINNPF
jgi:hypothetical protein